MAHPARLVGRKQELRRLTAALDRALEREGSIVALSGDPGIGKTRLARECLAVARGRGFAVLEGSANPLQGGLAYAPLLEAFGGHLRGLDAAPHAGLTHGLSDLGRLFRDLGLPEPEPLGDPALEKTRLFEAVACLLERLVEEQSVLLFLDDLHWADRASLDLLLHVVRNQTEAPLLVVGASRAGELERNEALAWALAELSRLRRLTTIAVGPLGAGDIAHLARDVLGAPVDSRLGTLLHQHSEGNPFFAEELLRGWAEQRLLAEQGGRWYLASSPVGLLPSSLVAAVRQRLVRLAPGVVDALRTAAIIGRRFEVSLLAEAVGEEAEAVEERLREAVDARLIHPASDGEYTFAHDKVRECLYADVTSVRRRRLHGFVGRALEQRGESDSARVLADLAFHFAHSGDRERGALYALRAADAAQHSYAFSETVDQYRTVLGLLPPIDPARPGVLQRLGEAALLAGAEREATAAFEEAQALYAQAGDSEGAGRAAHGLGRARWRVDELRDARAAFEEARRLLGDEPRPDAVRVLVDLATLLAVSLGQHTEGLARGQRALELARQLGDAQAEAEASRAVGNLQVRGNNLEDGIPLLERALALATRLDDPAEAAECCSCLALAYGWNGEIRRAFEMVERRVAFAERCRDVYQLRHAYTWLAGHLVFQGRRAEAEAMFARAEEVAERLASPEPLAFVYNFRSAIALFRGDYPAAEEWLTRAIEMFRAMGPGVLVWYLGPLALVQLHLGKQEEALATLAEVEALVAATPAGTMAVGDATTYLALAAVQLEDRRRAERYHRQLLPFAGRRLDMLTDRVLGELETLLGQWEPAEAHLEHAEAVAWREQDRFELAHVWAAQARLVLARGGRGSSAQARALLDAALAHCDAVGLAGAAERIRRDLARLPRGVRAQPPTRLPAGLSAREAAVLSPTSLRSATRPSPTT